VKWYCCCSIRCVRDVMESMQLRSVRWWYVKGQHGAICSCEPSIATVEVATNRKTPARCILTKQPDPTSCVCSCQGMDWHAVYIHTDYKCHLFTKFVMLKTNKWNEMKVKQIHVIFTPRETASSWLELRGVSIHPSIHPSITISGVSSRGRFTCVMIMFYFEQKFQQQCIHKWWSNRTQHKKKLYERGYSSALLKEQLYSVSRYVVNKWRQFQRYNTNDLCSSTLMSEKWHESHRNRGSDIYSKHCIQFFAEALRC